MITMNKTAMKKIKLLSLVLSISLAALASGPVSAQKAAKQETQSTSKIIPVDRIAAVVNNNVVTEMELQSRVHQTALNLRRQNIALPPMEALRDQILERMILERIIEQKARETGVRVDDNMLNSAIEQIAANNNMTVPQLEKRLLADGITFNNFRKEIRADLLTHRLREREVDDMVKIPESEVDQYIKDQLGPEKRRQYNLQRIVVSLPENPSREQFEEAQRTANKVLESARKGGNFSQLAARYSRSPDAMEGGNMGWKTANTLPPPLFDALKNAKTGDIVPLRAQSGFHIYKVLGSRDPGDAAEVQSVKQTRVRQIFMRPTNITPENVVVERMKKIKERIESGDSDFQTLARLHSADPSGTRGGDLGWIYEGDVPPELEAEINKLQKGQISEPIKTPFGYHLIQVTDRRTQQGVNERLRSQARDNLREQKINEATLDWERQLRDQAYVDKRIARPQD